MKNILTRLAIESGLNEIALERVMRGAPVRYKEFIIPKRDGEPRLISQPAREVKLVQRSLVEVLLKKLPVHYSATAYRTGISIADNADRHAGNGPILKMDFKSFFPSIRAIDWRNYCHTTGCVESEDEIELTSSLLFRRYPDYRELRLAIGAPSSPILSNILMNEFDNKISAAVAEESVTYTRYADDLTFSSLRTGYLTGVEKIVRRTLKDMDRPRLKINDEKTVYATNKYRRSVTGLILANDGRVTIGKDRKRLLNSAVYRAKTDILPEKQMSWLCGMLAFVHAVEPEFLMVLKRRYGSETIIKIQKHVKIPDSDIPF